MNTETETDVMGFRPVDIPAPDIKPFERSGFSVVEWGGTEVGK